MNNLLIQEVSKLDFEILIEKKLRKVLSEYNFTDNKPQESNYYSRLETAKKLKISLVTLAKLTSSGRLTAYRLGSKRVLYKQEDIEKALIPISTFNPEK